MTTKLPQLVLDAMDEAESFIRGFEDDETQGDVPGKILALIAAARLPWRDNDWTPDHTDTLLEIKLRKGEEHGFIRVRQWGEKMLVETFVPGREVCNEGDTPKTEPERTDWFTDRLGAAGCVDMILDGLGKQGWVKA